MLQCDETRPACGKCKKAKRVCTGYRDGLDLVLRSQNNVVKATVERRQKLKIPPSPMDDKDSQALCFFVSSWVLFPRDPQTDRGVTEILPLFFAGLRPGTPLSLSLAAISNFIFGAWEHGIRQETPQMQSAYGKALSAMRLALQDPNESCSDELLMSVLLLGFYEVT